LRNRRFYEIYFSCSRRLIFVTLMEMTDANKVINTQHWERSGNIRIRIRP